jgi:hypothetical protein
MCDWMVDDCSDGRVSLGKSRKGSLPEHVNLQMNGQRLYQLQRFLEEEIKKGGDCFSVRWLVVMSEHLREAIAEFNEARDREALLHR